MYPDFGWVPLLIPLCLHCTNLSGIQTLYHFDHGTRTCCYHHTIAVWYHHSTSVQFYQPMLTHIYLHHATMLHHIYQIDTLISGTLCRHGVKIQFWYLLHGHSTIITPSYHETTRHHYTFIPHTITKPSYHDSMMYGLHLEMTGLYRRGRRTKILYATIMWYHDTITTIVHDTPVHHDTMPHQTPIPLYQDINIMINQSHPLWTTINHWYCWFSSVIV